MGSREGAEHQRKAIPKRGPTTETDRRKIDKQTNRQTGRQRMVDNPFKTDSFYIVSVGLDVSH